MNDVDFPHFHTSNILIILTQFFFSNITNKKDQAIAKCLKKVIELQVPLLHQNVTEY